MRENPDHPQVRLVFKILPGQDWLEARRTGVVPASPDDKRDGFMHLSAAVQLAATAARHFRGRRNLVLLAIEPARLGAALKWEPSGAGRLFPHAYGAVPVAAVRWSRALALAPDGVPVIEGELDPC